MVNSLLKVTSIRIV